MSVIAGKHGMKGPADKEVLKEVAKLSVQKGEVVESLTTFRKQFAEYLRAKTRKSSASKGACRPHSPAFSQPHSNR